jgi:signal transduction histidine kinase
MACLAESIARTRLGILLAVGCLILVLIGAVIVLLVQRAAHDAQVVARALVVQDKMSNILLSARRAEAGQRGYLFTNQSSYLDDYHAARPEVEGTLRDLRAISADNPSRLAVLAQVETVLAAKFAELEKTVTLSQSGQREQARALVMSGTGRDLMNQLRKMIETAIDDESRLQAVRAEQSRHNNTLLLIVALIGAIMVMLIGALSVYLVQRNSRQRDSAQRELATTNANLEEIVEHRTADLTEANEEIQRFAYIVSHDLRSPLVNIMGFTTELESLRKDLFTEYEATRERLAAIDQQAASIGGNLDALGKDFDESITFIKASINKMDRLINAILRLSREGRREFRPETVDMTALVKSIEDSLAHQAEEADATITVGELPELYTDRLAVEQIFSNLIDNALKYLRAGTPGRIDITAQSTQSLAVFEIRDNGRGIDPVDHQRIFDLFRRAGAQDRPGEGIGLAHVRALVRRLGGYMGVSSEPGKGSVFTVTLPKRFGQTRQRRAA